MGKTTCSQILTSILSIAPHDLGLHCTIRAILFYPCAQEANIVDELTRICKGPFSEVVQSYYDNISDMLAISHGTAKEMFLSREILLLVKCMKNHVRSRPGFCAGWLNEKKSNKQKRAIFIVLHFHCKTKWMLMFLKLHDPKELQVCINFSLAVRLSQNSITHIKLPWITSRTW